MLRPILFLFITGCITQAQAQVQAQAQAQASVVSETTNQKLDRILASIEQKNDYANLRARNRGLAEEKVEAILVGSERPGASTYSFKKTLNQLQDDLQTVKGRQAAAAAIAVGQLLIFLAYLGTIGISYLVKCFKKQQEKQLVENLELMESRLQERKNKRRSAARPPKEQ